MLYEIFHRIAAGSVLESDAAKELVRDFHTSLGLEADASVAEVHARLLEDTPKHKRKEPARQRYELAFESFVDARWDIDCAIGGVSDGGVDPVRGYVFVGVRIEQWEEVTVDENPHLASRPRSLRKGDKSPGSTFAHTIGAAHKKVLEHAGRMFQRARKDIEGDAVRRLKPIPVRNRDIDWAYIRWLVPRPA